MAQPIPSDAGRPIALVGAASPSFAADLEVDLRTLGYQIVPIDLDAPTQPVAATVAVLVTEKSIPSCARTSERLRTTDATLPILWIVNQDDLIQLDGYENVYDDFVEAPYARAVLDARLRRARRRTGDLGAERLQAGELEMDLATYRASVAGHPLELTYMEYELLRFLTATRGRVHTREAILRNVWGYDYYGGIRTVDVHIRRLRAKLGQEHARLIETVRGVGYGFQVG